MADDSQAGQAKNDLPRDVETSSPDNQSKEDKAKTIKVQEGKKPKDADQ